MKKALLYYVVFLALLSTANAEEKPFVIITPSWNNAKWVERNLDSIFSQNYDNFRLIYIDDASDDGTADFVEEYVHRYGLEKKVTLIRNQTRKRALANIYHSAWLCRPDEIIALVDGDDWLAHRQVLHNLNEVYQNSDVWFTHGQFIYYPAYITRIGREFSPECVQNNAFRSESGFNSHLCTFYAGLFQKIKKQDLFYEGDFFFVCYDTAIMFPMLEMAGRHSRFVPDISYIYNMNTGQNDHTFHGKEQIQFDGIIRNLPKYSPIRHLFNNNQKLRAYVTPGLWGQLFAFGNPIFDRDNCLDLFRALQQETNSRDIELLQADSLENLEDHDLLIVFDVFTDQLPLLEHYPKDKLVLFLWEPPSVIPVNYIRDFHNRFSRVYTWKDDLVDNIKYFKFHLPAYRPMIADTVPYRFKRLATMIVANKTSTHPAELYSARSSLIQYYEEQGPDDFELYGKGWPAELRTYKGPVDKKVDILKYYRFVYAYENIAGIPGYVTEKIFDVFQAGSVPIYWGAPNVTDYIPKGCFIAREEFTSEAEVHDFIKQMDEETYQGYIDNIQRFLESDKAKLFTNEACVKTFLDLLTQY